MKSSTMRIGKRIMAVMLSLMMVAGIFAGMKLDVRAAINYVFDVTDPKQIEIAKTKKHINRVIVLNLRILPFRIIIRTALNNVMIFMLVVNILKVNMKS